MIEPTLDIDLDDVVDGFDDMIKAGRDFKPVFRRAGKRLRREIFISGSRKEGPEGKWDPLSKATLKRRREKRKRGQKPAVAILGKLRRAISIEYDNGAIRAVSKIPWSGVHQEGGTVGRGSVIPARPHVYANDAFMDYLVEEIVKHIVEKF